MTHPKNKFERNERKKQKREVQLLKEEQASRVWRKLYKENVKEQEAANELTAYIRNDDLKGQYG